MLDNLTRLYIHNCNPSLLRSQHAKAPRLPPRSLRCCLPIATRFYQRSLQTLQAGVCTLLICGPFSDGFAAQGFQAGLCLVTLALHTLQLLPQLRGLLPQGQDLVHLLAEAHSRDSVLCLGVPVHHSWACFRVCFHPPILLYGSEADTYWEIVCEEIIVSNAAAFQQSVDVTTGRREKNNADFICRSMSP